tara:strand:- start:81 stop:524 length:444 start_codon:yes stop_codon:yes gene_type:complete
MSAHGAAEFRPADEEADVVACFPLMHQLRPHLADAAELVERWRLQQQAGYRILALWRDRQPRALAGYRVVDNLIYGRHLYVDDLVTDEAERSTGLGARMLDRMKQETKALGCQRLVLDTAIDNLLGHRFYFRNGLLARGFRFSMPIA